MKITVLYKSFLYHNRLWFYKYSPVLIKLFITTLLFGCLGYYLYHNHLLNEIECLAIFIIVMLWAGYLLVSWFHSRTNEEVAKYYQELQRIKNS